MRLRFNGGELVEKLVIVAVAGMMTHVIARLTEDPDSLMLGRAWLQTTAVGIVTAIAYYLKSPRHK